MDDKIKVDYLFESSWEVCNKVGGIYTVVKSKAYVMRKFYNNYFLIGPYFQRKAMVELDEKEVPDYLQKAFDDLKKDGIDCYYGSWDVDGSPDTILIDFKGLMTKKNDIKKLLWEQEKIDSLNAHWEFEEPMLWSWAVGMLLGAVEKYLPGKKIVGHFHEWLAGFSIFYLNSINSSVKKVFTTHATMLGRTLAGNGEDLYGILDNINPEEKAYQYNVQDKFLTERASAQKADIFTTVSEITAIEAEKILGRKPEVILNNGLTMRKFPTIEETSVKHLLAREKIREFLTFQFYPYYNIDLDHNLVFFIVGRYEFKNKGIDVMIKALGKLNERLKKDKSKRTISTFFWIPLDAQGVKIDVLENKNYYRHIKNYVQWHSNDILKKIVMDIVSSKTPSVRTMFTKTFLKDLEKDLIRFKRLGVPSVLTHNISNEKNDPMLKALYTEGLDNKEDDKVKVIVYPVYLDGNDSLINLSYYDAIAGSHLGLFPSYYEPWGYTPLETAAMGVVSLTTDLAGFGRFITDKIPKDKNKGIYILKRFNRTEDEVVEDMYKEMYSFAMLSHEDRVKSKVIAKSLANTCDWANFVGNYIEAHNRCFEK
ncbi:MAG: glycogen/starch synthase [archaeon]